eukprot:SAG31_NODE_238_length_19470_cov_8.921532_5_plen_110_part_00
MCAHTHILFFKKHTHTHTHRRGVSETDRRIACTGSEKYRYLYLLGTVGIIHYPLNDYYYQVIYIIIIHTSHRAVRVPVLSINLVPLLLYYYSRMRTIASIGKFSITTAY